MGTRPKAGRADTGAHKGKVGFKDVHACLSITAVITSKTRSWPGHRERVQPLPVMRRQFPVKNPMPTSVSKVNPITISVKPRIFEAVSLAADGGSTRYFSNSPLSTSRWY